MESRRAPSHPRVAWWHRPLFAVLFCTTLAALWASKASDGPAAPLPTYGGAVAAATGPAPPRRAWDFAIGLNNSDQDGEVPHVADGGQHNAHSSVDGMIFILDGVLIGSILQMVQERYCRSVPYTAMLFLMGMWIAALHFLYAGPYRSLPCMGHWDSSIRIWERIDPHLVFYVFLPDAHGDARGSPTHPPILTPALIFAEAMRMNITLGSRLFLQMALLACPGVLLGSILTGAFGRYVLPYNWDWPTSFLFGSIMAATDPVAVLALFNTLGVSPRLTMLISGESLLNDGTAIALFTLVLPQVSEFPSEAEKLSVLGGGMYFLRMTVVAVVLGFAVAVACLIVIFATAESKYHTDVMIQVAVTILCAFSCFYFAESEVSTSGVISVVSGGLTLAYFAWPRFASKESILIVWEFIEFVGNTLIFLLAGLLFGHELLKSRTKGVVSWLDFMYLLLTYLAMILVRAVMIGALWPFMNWCGERISWQEIVVMIWSGLRGAVGLVLAIMVDRELHTDSASQILFLVGGMAVMTITINGTLTPRVLLWMDLRNTPEVEERTIDRCGKLTEEYAASALKEMMAKASPGSYFHGVSQDDVLEYLPTLASEEPDKEEGGSSEEMLKTYREIFMRNIRHHYWEAIDGGAVPRTSKVARILLYSAEQGIDRARRSPHKRIQDWKTIEAWLEDVVPRNRFMVWCCNIWPIRVLVPLQHIIPTPEALTLWKISAALAFIGAHRAAQAQVSEHFERYEKAWHGVQETVAAESRELCAAAGAYLDGFTRDDVHAAKSRMCAGRLLHLQLSHVAALEEEGILTAGGARALQHKLQEATREMAANVPDSGSDSDDSRTLSPTSVLWQDTARLLRNNSRPQSRDMH